MLHFIFSIITAIYLLITCSWHIFQGHRLFKFHNLTSKQIQEQLISQHTVSFSFYGWNQMRGPWSSCSSETTAGNVELRVSQCATIVLVVVQPLLSSSPVRAETCLLMTASKQWITCTVFVFIFYVQCAALTNWNLKCHDCHFSCFRRESHHLRFQP